MNDHYHAGQFWRNALVVVFSATLAVFAVRAWTGPTQPPAGGNPSGSNASGWISAGETWSYASADAPTFVITVPSDATTKYSPGMRIKLTQTTVKYFLVTAVSATTLTVYGGTDYTLTSATISSNFYSTAKAPQGFPLDPARWSVESTDTSGATQASPVGGTWYNVGSFSISVPIGAWKLSYSACVTSNSATTHWADGFVTFSTANNSESDPDFTAFWLGADQAQPAYKRDTVYREKFIALASKTSYYLNFKPNNGAGYIGLCTNFSKGILRAVSAHL